MDLVNKLEGVENRYRELTELLAQPEVISNREVFVKFNKENSELAPIVACYQEYKRVTQELIDSKELLDETKDDELREMALQDIQSLKSQEEKLKEEL